MTTNMNSEGDSKNILKIKNRNMLEIPFPRIFLYLYFVSRQTDRQSNLLTGLQRKSSQKIQPSIFNSGCKNHILPIALRIDCVRTDKMNNREA